MLKKHSVLFLALLSTTDIYAIPIESGTLSQPVAEQIGNTAVVGSNLNWQLIQKNQKLEEEVRKLRGQAEEHEHAIQQLKNELLNRYTDLDQRLELLNQRLDPDSDTAQEEATESKTEVSQEMTTAPQQTIPLSPVPTVPNK